MKADPYKIISYLLLIVVVLLFSTCSPQFSYGIKNFLFDGVPNQVDEYVSVVEDTLPDTTSTSGNKKLLSTLKRNDYNLHPPYKDRACTKCHDKTQMGKKLILQKGLCYQCHDSFADSYEVLHGPVAFGSCTMCHNPHKSKNKKLLLTTGQDLCFRCHNSKRVLAGEDHINLKENTNCTKCHNPHGGDNDKFLFN